MDGFSDGSDGLSKVCPDVSQAFIVDWLETNREVLLVWGYSDAWDGRENRSNSLLFVSEPLP